MPAKLDAVAPQHILCLQVLQPERLKRGRFVDRRKTASRRTSKSGIRPAVPAGLPLSGPRRPEPGDPGMPRAVVVKLPACRKAAPAQGRVIVI